MHNQAKQNFSKLRLMQKYKLVKESGDYIASRQFGSYNIHLYFVEGFYCEVWLRVSFNELYWIEPTDENRIAENYPDLPDPRRELGL